jgi:hypothetical protein
MLFASLVLAGGWAFLAERSAAQSPAPKAAPARTQPRTTSGPVVEATLAQLMRGILFPDSNVIFAAQSDNPADVPPAKDPATATNPLASTYGKWTAVENSGLAIAESANLLTISGRKCSNGLPVPMGNADWARFVQGVRDAGMQAYKAAQAKDQDKILEAAGNVSDACSNCHERYRDKGTLADRCR